LVLLISLQKNSKVTPIWKFLKINSISNTYFNFALGILITIILLTTGISLGQPSQNLSELMEKGKELSRLQQYEEALPYFEKVLEIDPTNIDALKSKSFILLLRGEFEEASSILDVVLELNPNDRFALNLKIMVLGNIDPEKAGTYLIKLAELDADIQSLLLKSQEHYKRSELEDALSYLNKVLEIEPDHLEALNGKAVILDDLGKVEESLQILSKAILLDPTNPILEKNYQAISFSIPTVVYGNGSSLKLLIRDSNGGLIGYQEAFGLAVFQHDYTEQFFDLWKVKTELAQEGQNYEVLQFRGKEHVDISDFFAQAYVSQAINGTTMPNISTLHHGVPTQKEVTIYELWTMVRPIG